MTKKIFGPRPSRVVQKFYFSDQGHIQNRVGGKNTQNPPFWDFFLIFPFIKKFTPPPSLKNFWICPWICLES